MHVADVVDDDGQFAFPFLSSRDGILQFGGAVVFSAHSGMLNVRIQRPSLRMDGRTAVISIDDPWEPDEPALEFGRGALSIADDGAAQIVTAHDLVLTEDASDLFNGAYVAGAPIAGAVARVPAGSVSA